MWAISTCGAWLLNETKNNTHTDNTAALGADPSSSPLCRHTSSACAVQFHRNGSQFDFVRLPSLTPYGGASYVE